MDSKEPEEDQDMRPEYDFTGGVRGKHYKQMQNGYTVIIHNEDGSTTVKHYPPPAERRKPHNHSSTDPAS